MVFFILITCLLGKVLIVYLGETTCTCWPLLGMKRSVYNKLVKFQPQHPFFNLLESYLADLRILRRGLAIRHYCVQHHTDRSERFFRHCRAAFQFGIKMSEGRKTRRAGPKDEKAKLDRDWQKISQVGTHHNKLTCNISLRDHDIPNLKDSFRSDFSPSD